MAFTVAPLPYDYAALEPTIDAATMKLHHDKHHQTYVDKLNDRWESALWIMNADGTKNRFLVKGSGARWSPDGRTLAYVRFPETANRGQLTLMDPDGSNIRQLGHDGHSPDWSPDAGTLVFTNLLFSVSQYELFTLDLSGLRFLDTSGLRLILETAERIVTGV